MNAEHCTLKAELYGDGLETQNEVALAARNLTVSLGNPIHSNFGRTKNGHGFIFNSECDGFNDAGKCLGICLKERLKKTGLEKKAEITGDCLKDKH